MKTRRILSLAIAGVIATAVLPSCLRQKFEETYSSQDDAIDRYVKSVLDTAKSAETTYIGGSCRLTKTPGTGEGLKEHGTITFHYAGYVFSGRFSKESLFCTNREESAHEAGWTTMPEDLTALTVCLKDADFVTGLKNGLKGIRAGEECEIIFSGKYGFGRKPFGIVPANSALLYKIWVKSISND